MVDTGDKFAAGVIDTGGAPWLANIPANFRKNYLKQKIALHCPFNTIVPDKVRSYMYSFSYTELLFVASCTVTETGKNSENTLNFSNTVFVATHFLDLELLYTVQCLRRNTVT